MSTPGSTGSASTSIRRKERYREDAAAEQDWAGVDPDEAFRRLPVAEVKRVEGKMRYVDVESRCDAGHMVSSG
jgi:hypothetical protein